MQKFYRRFFFFILILLLYLFIGLLLPDRRPVESMHYCLKDKEYLLKTIKSPRIIFIGGSNISFGLNSKMIKDSLGIDVINFGTHGGYGLKYMMDCMSPYVKKDDIIIIAPEYNHFYGSFIWGESVLIQSALINSNIDKLNFYHYLFQLKNIPRISISNYYVFFISLIPGSSKKETVGIYNRKAFNEYGDASAHWGLPGIPLLISKVQGKFNNKTIKYINQFQDLVELNKAKLYITFPCLARSSYDPNKVQINKVVNEFEKNEYNLLGNSKRYSLPDSLYFNTFYHLNKQGADVRSNLLIQDIKATNF